MIKKTILCGLLLTALSAVTAVGQVLYGQPTSGMVQFQYTDWTIESDDGESSINQLAIPVSGFVPLADNFEALFYIANASNNLTDKDNEYDLSGMSDFRLMFNKTYAEDQLVTSLAISLPTGKRALDLEEEWLVIDYLSDNYLDFPIRRFGEGLGVSALLGAAGASGNMRYGAGAMYQYNGSYEPYDGYDDYDPGNMFSFNVGAEMQNEGFTLGGDVIITLYTDDKADDVKIFKQGTQIDFRLQGSYDNKLYIASGGIQYLARGAQTGYDPETETEIESLKAYGNEFVLFGGVSWSPAKDWMISPAMDLKLISANERGFDNSSVFGIGTGIGRSLGANLKLDVGVKYYVGSADGGNLDLSGYRITGGLTGLL